MDATVAVHFAHAVVNPEAGNIGGGGFLVAQMADGTAAALDFRKTAPLAATRDMFLDDQGNLTDRSVAGHLAAGVPGSVAGMWEAHRRRAVRDESHLSHVVHLQVGDGRPGQEVDADRRRDGDQGEIAATSFGPRPQMD